MSDEADIINSRQQWVDSDTRGLDGIRKRVCFACVQPPLIKLGTWVSGVAQTPCQSCGTTVTTGAIVVDPALQARQPKARTSKR
jgi:hypothetical protein